MKRTWILPLMPLLALVVTLGAPTARAEDDGTAKGRVATAQKSLSLTKVSLADAITTAAKKAEGTAIATDFEVEDGVPIFEVVVYVGGDSPHFVEVEVDAVTGKVIETEILGRDDDDAEDDDADEEGDDEDVAGALKEIAAALPSLKITLAKAVAVAAAKAEGTAFLARFEVDDGIPTFEVFVLAGGDAPRLVDVDIDARDPNGKVLEMETVGKGGQDDDEEEEGEDEEGGDDD